MANIKVIKEIISLEENNTFSIVDIDMNNVATAVIRNGDIKLYFIDKDPIAFGSNFDELTDWVNERELYFHKLLNGNHRWKKYNPNPDKKNVGDCSLRAYCAVFNIEWGDAFDEASCVAKANSLMMDTHKTCEIVMKNHGYVIDEEFKKSKRKDLTVNEFAMTHPYGRYFLNTHGHLVAVVDGEYYDSWDSGDKKVKKIYTHA